MKAKDLLEEKVMKLTLLDSEESKKVLFDTLKEATSVFFSDSNKKLSEKQLLRVSKKIIKPYLDSFRLYEMLNYIKFKDKKYYRSLMRKLDKNQAETEINISEIEQKFPVIKQLNEAFSVYKKS